MATYVIGDLQGCFDELQELLKSIHYQAEKDHLWFVGDVVNRGPKSLECLRFVKQLHDQGRGAMVLGNHDFHLLAAYSGLEKFQSKSDTLQPILESDDADELIEWLRFQPLVLAHPVYDSVMVHAGIPPQWSIAEAQSLAKEVEVHLQSDQWQTLLTDHLFGSEPDEWHNGLTGWDRIRYIVNAFARMRYCDNNGKLDFKKKSAPDGQEGPIQPWFVFPNRRNKTHDIFFGHWSTLGEIDAYSVHATDTGCLWGGKLSAYCLETRQRHTFQCQQTCKPKVKKKKKTKLSPQG